MASNPKIPLALEPAKLSVVVPIYNEAFCLSTLLAGIDRLLPGAELEIDPGE